MAAFPPLPDSYRYRPETMDEPASDDVEEAPEDAVARPLQRRRQPDEGFD